MNEDNDGEVNSLSGFIRRSNNNNDLSNISMTNKDANNNNN